MNIHVYFSVMIVMNGYILVIQCNEGPNLYCHIQCIHCINCKSKNHSIGFFFKVKALKILTDLSGNLIFSYICKLPPPHPLIKLHYNSYPNEKCAASLRQTDLFSRTVCQRFALKCCYRHTVFQYWCIVCHWQCTVCH